MCLFREPDAGNLPVRIDEREPETESSQTGLRRRRESFVNSRLEANATAPVLDSTRDCAHPMREDVKEKILSPPLAGNQGVVTYIQPCLLIRGAFDFYALARRGFQRRGQPQLLVPTHRFHETVALDAVQFRSYASYLLAQVPTTILSETRGL